MKRIKINSIMLLSTFALGAAGNSATYAASGEADAKEEKKLNKHSTSSVKKFRHRRLVQLLLVQLMLWL